MERPSRSAIFRSKMQLQKEKRQDKDNQQKQQLPIHKRRLSRQDELDK